MTTTTPAKETRQRGTKGVNPAWANLPKRHCDDCGKKYKPFRPVKEGERGFCNNNCRKSYHKHGGAYRKLRVEVQKMVNKEIADRLRLEEPCGLCGGIGEVTPANWNSKAKPRMLPCPKCLKSGTMLTWFGREVLDFVQRRSGELRSSDIGVPSPNPSHPM
jgi:Tryptophan RNA-binding attenuator protein inhibitory protein